MSRKVFLFRSGSKSKFKETTARLKASLDDISSKLKTEIPQAIKLDFETDVVDTYVDIKEDTPKKSGKARAGWNLTRREVKNESLTFIISNSVQYIGLLEFGRPDGTPHSMQAPQGMFRINLLVFEEKLKRLKRKVLANASI